MGIYDSENIFGIKMYIFDDDVYCHILYEKKYNEIMSDEEKKKAYIFYTELNNTNHIHFQYYTECSTTYDTNTGTFLRWSPMSLNTFLEKFK
jgi:hypothetical protein